MNVFDSIDKLLEKFACLKLSKFLLRNDVFEQFAPNSILGDKVYVFFSLYYFVQLDNVRMSNFPHDFDFPIQAVLICFIDNFAFLYYFEDDLLVC